MSGLEKPIPMSSTRVTNLRGEANVPGDKSISHRALIIGSLVTGKIKIKNLILNLEEALIHQRFSDDDGGYTSLINLNSFIDWFLINEITKNIDAGAFFSSVYLTINVDGKISLGPIWDFDLSMTGDHEGWWMINAPWFELFLQDPYFVDRVKQRFEYFYANKAEILDKVDAFGKYLELASEQNDLKWQTIGTYVFPNPTYFESYDQELHFLKTWIAVR